MPWKSKASSHSKTKNVAYLVYSEWGSQRSIPRDQRLSQEFPEIPQSILSDWMEEFRKIEHEIWKIAEQGGPKTFSYADFKNRLHKTFPFMDEEAMSRAWTLCGYYTWHEGY